jgi:pimeloyl-ACP methyl ester carboxylesterase
VAAARLGEQVAAVVSRGGRPDLAAPHLAAVTAPTLLLVGARDQQVLELNRRAMEQMTCEVQLIVVPGAGHLFSEPGTLEEVGRRAATWFITQLHPGGGAATQGTT